MAHIPVNPERRDPGYFKKKAEIGLPNVDNMSAAEFVNAVSEDIKILNNKKKRSSKITKKGEFYGGIVKTARGNSHAEFTLGLFNSSNPSKELATIHVDFAFSCTSPDEFGHVNYTVECPDEDPYLQNLYIVFSQVQDQLYVTLHSPSLPTRSAQNYFNVLGLDLLEWTEGVEKLDLSKDISEIVKNHELSRVRLNKSGSTVGSDSADALSVYNGEGQKVSLDNLSTLDGYDYPSINGVPFVGKRKLLIGNEETGRHIEVPAYHKDSTREGSGIHNWEVLGDLRKSSIHKSDSTGRAQLRGESPIPNLSDYSKGYGLSRPTSYDILGDETNPSIPRSIEWLNTLGEDSDVITVGAFKEFMSYLINAVTGNKVSSYHIYLENSEEDFKYVSSSESSITLNVWSYEDKIGDGLRTNIPVRAEILGNADWLGYELLGEESGSGKWMVKINISPNPQDRDRAAKIRITQESTYSDYRFIDITILQTKFEVKYGVLLDGVPIFEDSGYRLNRWENSGYTGTLSVVPIKNSNTDPRGYSEIENCEDIEFINNNSWINGDFSDKKNLKITVESNYMSSIRTGTFYFGILESLGDKIKYVPVNCSQTPVDSVLSVDGDSTPGGVVLYSTGKELTTIRSQVSSNYPWSVAENTVPSWITLSGYSGERPSGTSGLTMIISENDTQSIRTAEIQIVNKGGSQKTIKITQIPRTVYIDINNQAKDQAFSFLVTGGYNISSVTVEVNSNVNWFIDQCPSWITPSRYDGGEQGKVTNVSLTLSMPEPEYSTVPSIVSLAYYDETSKTIYALRKISITPSSVWWNDSNDYVLPQTPLSIDVTSEGGPVTIGALSSTKYKLLPISEPTGAWGTESSEYAEMLEDYSEDRIYESEIPPTDTTKLTHLTFGVTKNDTAWDRHFSFILIEADSEFTADDLDPSEFPVFTVYQPGHKEIIPITYSDDAISDVNTSDLGFWVIKHSGVTSDVAPVYPLRDPRFVKDKVYDGFEAREGQIILLTRTGEDATPTLYKTPQKTTVLGDNLEYIWSVIWGDVYGWYEVKETGFYFSSTGKAKVITPSTFGFNCDSSQTEFNLTLLSVMNNSWDVYNDTLPSWISLEKITGTSNFDTFKVLVDENVGSADRNYLLQFYVDSLERTIKSFPVSQTGLEVTYGDSEYLGITPVISSGRLTFTSGAFELGLSSLTEYSNIVTVNGVEHRYTYSEYQRTGVGYFVPESLEGVSIIEDSYGKPKLVVSANETGNPRTIDITASYNGKQGVLRIIQGSSETLQYYTYSDLRIQPDFTVIPYGVSKIGFNLYGKTTLNTLNTTTGEVSSGEPGNEERIIFPFTLDKLSVNNSGLLLLSPETLEYTGVLNGETIISYPTSKFVLTEDGEVNEISGTIETPGVTFVVDTDGGSVTVGKSLLSGERKNTILSTKVSFTDYPGIIIKRMDSPSDDIGTYLSSNIQSSQSFTENGEIVVKIEENLTEYLENKIMTFQITPEDDKTKVLKYVHFRLMRALPEINCTQSGTTYTSDGRTSAKIEVSSNIGYNASPWSNEESGVHIKNGTYYTSEARLNDTRVVEYSSESQPSRKWYKKYATEALILKDADNYGITKETPIVLPEGAGSIPGFEITQGDTKITKFSDTSNSYNLYLPYVGGNARLRIKSYDSYTVTSSQRVINPGLIEPSINNSISPLSLQMETEDTKGDYQLIDQITVPAKFRLLDSRSWIQTKVGSLGEMGLTIECSRINTGTNNVYLGAVVIKSTTRTFTINVYQSSQTGVANITDPGTKMFVIGENNSITFSHTYPGWFIVSSSSTSQVNFYPKFNNKTYNPRFGSSGNSGSTSTNGNGTSTVFIEYPEKAYALLSNNSLELRQVSDTSGTPNSYGIKTAPVDTLQVSSGNVKITDTLKIMTRPDVPKFEIFQKVDNVLTPVTTELAMSVFRVVTSSGMVRVMKGVEFYVSSDIFERTLPYLQKTIKIQGEDFNVYNVRSVFEKLIKPVTFQYKTTGVIVSPEVTPGKPSITPSVLPTTITLYRPLNYETIDGKIYAYYKSTFGVATYNGLQGSVAVQMDDFVVDPMYYQGKGVTKSVLSFKD